jgi:hypothetical protein
MTGVIPERAFLSHICHCPKANAMLKYLVMSVLALGLLPGLLAQTETLAGEKGGGGFGGPFMELSRMTGVTGATVGGGGGAIFGSIFFGGFGQAAGFGAVTLDDVAHDVSMGIGGLWLGYTYRQHKLVHPFASLKFGWGGIHIRPEDKQAGDRTYSKSVTALYPEAGLEVNLTRWFRLALTGGYRMVHGVRNLPGQLDAGDFNSFTGSLTFRFGGFPD